MLGDRLVVLRNLVALGQIGIKVVFAREDRPLAHFAIERQCGKCGEFHGLRVEHRQRSRQAQADRTDICVGAGAKAVGASAKRLARGEKLHMHFKPDDGFVFGQNIRRNGGCRHI